MNTERVFTPAELALIEKHRDFNVDYGWWDGIYSDFIEVAAAFGFSVDHDDIRFSGFWSQGDGASFTFRVTTVAEVLLVGHATMEAKTYGDDPDKFEGYLHAFYCLWKDLSNVFDTARLTCPEGRALCEGMRIMSSRISTHYSHSGTVQACFEIDSEEAGEAAKALKIDYPLDEFYDKAIEYIANALYDTLQAEYEGLTSNERVWESLEANGIKVEEDLDVAA